MILGTRRSVHATLSPGRGARVLDFPLAARHCWRVTDGNSLACFLRGSTLRFWQRGLVTEWCRNTFTAGFIKESF